MPRRLLQREEQRTGAIRVDAIGGEGIDYLKERGLDIVQSSEGRKVEGFSAAADAGELLQALVIALVEVTELLCAKCGRAAKDAIVFQMVTGTVGHKTSK